jgi:hypothetical protein
VRDQLAAADAEVRKRFPELFEPPRRGDPEEHEDPPEPAQGRREPRTPPPDLAGGSRSGGGAAKAKAGTFEGLPADVQATFDRTFRTKGVDPERYAKTWFRNQGR